MHARSLLVLGLLATACGGAQGERPEESLPDWSLVASAAVDCSAIDALSEVRPIDDFESGGAEWYNNYFEPCTPADEQAGTCARIPQTPSKDAYPLPAEPQAAEDRCGSGYAFHLYGGTYEQWATLERQLPDAPFEGGAYDGIAFWAKRGAVLADASSTLTIALRDRFTDGGAASLVDASLQGTEVCDPTPPEGDETVGCGSSAFTVVGLQDTWRLFKVPFSKFHQPSWGFQAPYLDTGALWTVKFTWAESAPVSVDFWIDDVMFYAE